MVFLTNSEKFLCSGFGWGRSASYGAQKCTEDLVGLGS